MAVSEGQRLGNYLLHRLLGKGSFADVYLGEHLYLNDYAALKILHTVLSEREEQLFLAEAQTIAQLTHPNIVRVRDFGIDRSIPYLVMEYARGGTLRHHYPRGTCLSLEQTVTYIKQIASGLQYAHNHGLIHRDVKPENVLQGARGVMLSDFGITVSVAKADTSASETWAGTLPYMAPEQFQGKPVFASDQYALAVVAYEWLCGVRPFEGARAALAYQHAHVPPPPLQEKDPSLPEAVEAVILKALSKDPEQRYVSVLTFARALERASRGTSGSLIGTGSETEDADAPVATAQKRVFLSHAAFDDLERLRVDLLQRDIALQGEEVADTPEEQMRQAMRAAQAVLLVLTSYTRASAVVQEHLRIAQLYRRRIIGLWIEGEELHELLPAGAEVASILDARAERYRQALDELALELEREQRGVTTVAPPVPDLTFEPRNPYKGLRAFTEQDRADFFGRHALVGELLATLRRQIESPLFPQEQRPRLLSVVGPSGSGKSSVVRAGLLPALQEGALPHSEYWVYLGPLVPNKQPLEALAHLLASRFPEQDLPTVREVLSREGSFGLHQLGLTLLSQPEANLVVTIDQFEELFSSDISEPERRQFIELLVHAASVPSGRVVVLLTLRADFYDRPFAYPALGRLIQQQQCAVLPMSPEELREVIERPALLPDVRLTFDEDLVNDLLSDMRDQPGALPLLEFTLEQLFHHRRDHRLTRYAYQEIGGVRGALAQHAEATYAALPSEEHRHLARTLFLRLVQPGTHEQAPLRRRAEASEFVLEEASQTQVLQQVIDAFLAARLLTSTSVMGGAALEISHEALIGEWPRLSTWLQEAREDMQLQQSLSQDVREWESRGWPRDHLYRGVQLREARAWASRNRPSEQEALFLQASASRQMLFRMMLVALALVLVSSLGVGGWLFITRPPDPTLVTTLQDNVNGSLRYCIANAPNGAVIHFAQGLHGTIHLQGSLGFLSHKTLTIEGPGADQLAISGAQGTTNDTFANIIVPSSATVTISGLSFTNSSAFIYGFLFNAGVLTVKNSIISNNNTSGGTFTYGGGIFNIGLLTVIDSTFSGNTVSGGIESQGGAINNSSSLIVIHSTFLNNIASNYGNSVVTSAAGAIFNSGWAVVANSTFSGNRATNSVGNSEGGGIANGGKLILIHNTFSNNIASSSGGIGAGGAIENSVQGQSSLYSNTFSNNSASGGNSTGTNSTHEGRGGAIENEGKMSLENSIFSNNSARSSSENSISFGGGINNNTGQLTVGNSTFSNNTAIHSSSRGYSAGGGVVNAGQLTMFNSTFLHNDANTSSGVSYGGGMAILNLQGVSTVIRFSTIYGNMATIGGGISIGGTSSNHLTISSSIVVANQALNGPDISGTLTSDGYNLFTSFAGAQGLNASTDRAVEASNLKIASTLNSNKGAYRIHLPLTSTIWSLPVKVIDAVAEPTPTLALLPGSPAIDVIPAQACHFGIRDTYSGDTITITADQRDDSRPGTGENSCDIGAYEYQS